MDINNMSCKRIITLNLKITKYALKRDVGQRFTG